MQTPVNAQDQWPRRRWAGLVGLCFLAQVILIVLLGERRASPLTAMPFKTGIHLISDTWSLEQMAAFSDMSDPSVFALPSLDGFSSAGWLAFKPARDEFAEAPDEPRWLALDADRLGSGFAAYVASNAVVPLRIADEAMPELAGMQPRPSAELEFPKSALRVEGALARRKLLARLELPSWPHSDVLANSVVYLLVDHEGAPLSSALVSGSGSREADRHALAAAKRLRFKPLDARDAVTSGTLRFSWHTVPPTNLSPGLLPR